MRNKKIISILGGNGFIGRYLCDTLLDQGYYLRIISRSSSTRNVFYPSSKLGQYSQINCDILDKEKLIKLLEGSFCVINLVGILEPKGKNSFKAVHVTGVLNIIESAKVNKISKIIHISALGIDKNKKSTYATTKLKAEKKILEFKNSLIIRPSIVCGDEDNFLNFFAKYIRLSPVIPLIGMGKTKFQPILVTDLVEIIVKCINKSFKENKVIEVGGPDTLTFKQILEFLLVELKSKRLLLSISFSMAKKIAFILEKMPFSILTMDQVEMLKTDSVMSKNKAYTNFFSYEASSFYIYAKKQLKAFSKKGGHF